MRKLRVDTRSPPLSTPDEEAIGFGRVRLLPKARRLERDGVPVPIGGRALDLLLVLATRPGQVIPAEDLLVRVWPHATVGAATLRVQMAALRRALGEEGRRFISTVSGRGYVLNVAPSTPTHPAGSWDPMQRPSLPPRSGRIAGRSEVIAELVDQLFRNRFITVTGAGGIGKTTVALEVARRFAEAAGVDAYFVDFSATETPEMATATLLAGLGLMGPQPNIPQSIANFAMGGPLLLVLDNCEHVVDVVAGLAERLIAEIPLLRIVATSREPLRARGERVRHLQPLATPPPGSRPTAEEALRYPAVEMLVDRASARAGDFEFTDSDVPAAAEVCVMLDGMPLAIEIAACQAHTFGLTEMASLLARRLDLDWQGLRTTPPRQRTLSTAIAWSYQLLTAKEQRSLGRLAIFVGPFSLEAAQAISADLAGDAQIARMVESLTAKSLVSAADARETRLRLLHVTRAFALEQLLESGDLDEAARRHAVYFTGRLARAGASPASPAQNRALLGELAANVRGALTWSFGPTGDAEIATALAAQAGAMFVELSLFEEGEAWMRRALPLLTHSPEHRRRAIAISAALAAGVMFSAGSGPDGRELFERAIGMAEQLDDYASALKLMGLFNLFLQRIGDFEGVHETARRSVELAKRLGDGSALRVAQWTSGVSAMQAGDHRRARLLCESALLPTEPGDRFVYGLGYDHRVRALVVEATTLWLQGFPDRAAEAAVTTLQAAQSARQPVPTCVAYLSAIGVLLWNGDLDRVAELVRWLIDYAERHSLPPFRIAAQGFAQIVALQRDASQVEPALLLQEHLRALVRSKYFTLTPNLAARLAKAQAALGRFPEARKTIGDVLAHSSAEGSVFHSDLLRVQGEILIADPDASSDEGEQKLQEALEVARRQGDLSWELRAAIALGRVLQSRGRVAEALVLVGSVYRQFHEGFDTADLTEARRFLEAGARST